ncbi:type II and III secretion system protein family protein [Microvirga arabica]|uniref:type II and III secretion system protein family protein n=1 Tax=Microvirga arabica TaxID=1128671 RepID=UPI00193AAEB2|nr:type II and III secretion system protein family protein [Microvirga arabica]MBM1172011.1 type II and III secretion system protein family protein [Microvirga arabica]
MAARTKPRILPAVVTALAVGGMVCEPMVGSAPAYAQARAQAAPGGAKLVRTRVTINKSQTVRMEQPFTDVLVGATEIADVIPLSDQTLYVLGKKVGTTNVSILNEQKQIIGVVDVEVGPDAANVAEKIGAGGGSGIRVRGSGEQVILEGMAADSQEVDRAVEIARSVSPGGVINATKVVSPQQVMLQVRFIEVSRTAGRELGIQTEFLAKRGLGLTNIATGVGISSVPFAQVLSSWVDGSRSLDILIQAMESKGLVRRLAEPNLVALSGGRASFHAGGEIPIPIARTTDDGGTPTITIDYKEFGVKLDFLPVVLSNGLINITLTPEVSDIDRTLSVPTGGGIAVPGITVRRATTQVELRDGQSFALAGLIQNVTDRNIQQLPWLGSLPVLGALFRSTEFQSRETELVVIVTPHLVKPAKPGELLATPLDKKLPANDADLFITGKLEVDQPIDPSAVAATQKWVTANGTRLKGPFGHVLPQPGSVAPAYAAGKPPASSTVVRAKN